MTINTGGRIEASSEFVLSTWGEFALAFDHDNLILIQCPTEKVKVIILYQSEFEPNKAALTITYLSLFQHRSR